MSKFQTNGKATAKQSDTPIKMSRKQKRKKERQIGIDPSKQNEAGFYEGMAGVFVDELGNRRILEISLTPDADVLLRMGAHPIQMNQCQMSLMETSPMFRQMILTCSKKWRRGQLIGRIKTTLIKWMKYIRKKLSFSREQESKPGKSMDIVK
jgi:hypothetical protein